MARENTPIGEEVRTLGRYRVIAKLGQGGMAKVFLTVVPGPAGVQKLLVVKELRPEIAFDEDIRTMFLDEARLAARLNHPNVVQTYEVGEERGHYFIAMEYLEGQPLNRLWRRMAAERLPLEAHLRILADVLAGLHYAHELTDFDGTPLHVVHRDVSPHNVFVTYDGQVKLVDFGIAKAASARGSTKNGIFKGKVTYASPEQALGTPIDRRSDIFSTGVMLWEALAQQRMWGKKPEVAVLLALSSGEWQSPRSVNPDVAPALESICMRALARAPEDRFATAAEFQHALEELLERSPVRVSPRQIGQFVTEQFADERSRIRETVDAQIRRMAAGGSSAAPAPIPMLLDEDREISPVPSSERFVDQGLGAATDASRLTPSPVAPRAGWKRMVGPIAFGAVCLAALLFIALRPARRPPAASSEREEASAIPAPSASSSASSARANEGAEATIAISVRAVPSSAQLFLDDVALASNPFESKVPRDGRAHRVRAAASGYASAEEVVSFDSPLKVVLVLKPPAAAPRLPPPKPEPELRPVKPKRSVDEQDPYAR